MNNTRKKKKSQKSKNRLNKIGQIQPNTQEQSETSENMSQAFSKHNHSNREIIGGGHSQRPLMLEPDDVDAS